MPSNISFKSLRNLFHHDTIQEKVDPIISTSQFNCHLKEQIITGLLRWSIYFKKRYEDGSDGSWNKKNCKQDRKPLATLLSVGFQHFAFFYALYPLLFFQMRYYLFLYLIHSL